MKKENTAGGIITKKENNALKICLVELVYPKTGYAYPKGHLKKGETFEQAALREVNEELGLRSLEVIDSLGYLTRASVKSNGKKVLKTIYMYLFTTDNFEQVNSEETYAWFSYDEALEKLTFQEEKEFLKTNWSKIIHLAQA